MGSCCRSPKVLSIPFPFRFPCKPGFCRATPRQVPPSLGRGPTAPHLMLPGPYSGLGGASVHVTVEKWPHERQEGPSRAALSDSNTHAPETQAWGGHSNLHQCPHLPATCFSGQLHSDRSSPPAPKTWPPLCNLQAHQQAKLRGSATATCVRTAPNGFLDELHHSGSTRGPLGSQRVPAFLVHPMSP